MWLAAWKLVSNDAKRTVAPPNAKHSTLPQGCFLCFLFLITFTIRQQCIIYLQQTKRTVPLVYPQKFSTEPLRGEWWRKNGNAGRCLGLALGVGVFALEAPHYSGGRLFQHGEFILFHYLLFGELHCAVAVNGLHDVDA